MHDAVLPLALLALTVGALLGTRSRRLLTQVVVEGALLLAIGLFLVARDASPLPHLGILPDGALGAVYRALAVVWWLIGARLAVTCVAMVRGRDPRSRKAGLFFDLTAGVVYLTVVLIIFNSVLDLNINSLLATSGVVAIVLGLALQNTLADVFSGIAVGLEQPFRVGDRVSLGGGIEGVVVSITWRSVRVQTDDDDLATLPNSVIARGQIINRSVPTQRRAATVEVATPADLPATTVFELLRQATLLCPDLLEDPAPAISLRRVGVGSNIYAIRFYVADTPALLTAKSVLLRQASRLLQNPSRTQDGAMLPEQHLARLAMFSALSAEQLQELATDIKVRDVEPGDVVFAEGDESRSIFVIAAGVMQMSHQGAQYAPQPADRIGTGEYVGEVGLLTGRPRACSMTALTSGRILELPGDRLNALLKANAEMSDAMELSVRRGLASHDRDAATHLAHATEPTSISWGA